MHKSSTEIYPTGYAVCHPSHTKLLPLPSSFPHCLSSIVLLNMCTFKPSHPLAWWLLNRREGQYLQKTNWNSELSKNVQSSSNSHHWHWSAIQIILSCNAVAMVIVKWRQFAPPSLHVGTLLQLLHYSDQCCIDQLFSDDVLMTKGIYKLQEQKLNLCTCTHLFPLL